MAAINVHSDDHDMIMLMLDGKEIFLSSVRKGLIAIDALYSFGYCYENRP